MILSQLILIPTYFTFAIGQGISLDRKGISPASEGKSPHDQATAHINCQIDRLPTFKC